MERVLHQRSVRLDRGQGGTMDGTGILGRPRRRLPGARSHDASRDRGEEKGQAERPSPGPPERVAGFPPPSWPGSPARAARYRGPPRCRDPRRSRRRSRTHTHRSPPFGTGWPRPHATAGCTGLEHRDRRCRSFGRTAPHPRDRPPYPTTWPGRWHGEPSTPGPWRSVTGSSSSKVVDSALANSALYLGQHPLSTDPGGGVLTGRRGCPHFDGGGISWGSTGRCVSTEQADTVRSRSGSDHRRPVPDATGSCRSCSAHGSGTWTSGPADMRASAMTSPATRSWPRPSLCGRRARCLRAANQPPTRSAAPR